MPIEALRFDINHSSIFFYCWESISVESMTFKDFHSDRCEKYDIYKKESIKTMLNNYHLLGGITMITKDMMSIIFTDIFAKFICNIQ